ncbi:MAG: nodulation protein NfeD, partial [Pseudomonadota bacterium]
MARNQLFKNHRPHVYGALMAIGSLMMLLAAISQTIAQDTSNRGTILTLSGPVTPPIAEYLEREISAASQRGEELVILEIDTPGGLLDSMKTIIKAILASETPAVTFVSPQGAQSASAGLYIMYAAHVSAMAPYTNTGSATPIQMGESPGREPSSPFDLEDTPNEEPAPASEGTEEASGENMSEATEEAAPAEPADISNEASMRGKIIEDSVAYIRGLAEERGRNADWAEKAVRPPSASVTAREALELNVIEIVADDLDDLMGQLDGRVVTTPSGEKTLSTENVSLTRVEPNLFETILSFIANPNVAAILFTLGTTGLIVELWYPGSIVPGFMGALSLILALYSFSVLPFNTLALAIIGLGIILIILEAFSPSFGLIGVTGLALFGVGLYFLYPDDFRVATGLIIGIVAAVGVFLFTILIALVRSRSHGPLIGQEAIRKRLGRVDDWNMQKGEGYVIVDGERWHARSKEPLKAGDRIKVQDMDGIILIVRKAQGSLSAA